MNFFKRIVAMLTNRPILGVGPGEVQTADDQTDAKFLPASQIHGVSQNYRPWRVAADGEQWFERVDSETPAIHGEATDDDLKADDYDEPIDTSDILEAFNRECALIKARHARGELPDSSEDDDSMGYPDDEC